MNRYIVVYRNDGACVEPFIPEWCEEDGLEGLSLDEAISYVAEFYEEKARWWKNEGKDWVLNYEKNTSQALEQPNVWV